MIDRGETVGTRFIASAATKRNMTDQNGASGKDAELQGRRM